jgi:predicted nucleic acid-binding protein
MINEYVGSLGTRHNLTKYILSNDVEVVLSDAELQELFEGSKLGNEIKILESENQKLEYQRDYYKGLIKDLNNILTEMRGV